MRKLTATGLVCIAVAILQGCFYDKEELVYPTTTPVNCDTANMKFSTTISALVQARCSGCHTGAVTSGFNFSNYSPLKFRATSGVLMDRLTTSDPTKLMPQGGPKLPACEIEKFRAWANAGAPN